MTVEFTYRQWEIYELLLKGLTYKEIALKLRISVKHGAISSYTCMMRKVAKVKTNKEMISKIGNPPGWFTRYKSKERKDGHVIFYS